MNLSKTYSEFVGIQHRRRMAQFFTPPAIARFMAGWVAAGPNGRKIHDPAFGLGAFLDGAPENCLFTGEDADEKILDFFNDHSGVRPHSLKRADYLLDFGAVHDNIVCNPPYLRFQKFSNRDAVFAAFRERFGIRLSGYTNTASAFLIKSISELKPNGRLAYILPSEFLNTGYGTVVKDLLSKDGHLDSVIEVACEKDAFDEVTTSVCIVLYDSAKTCETVSFRRISSMAEIDNVLDSPPVNAVVRSMLDPCDKWGRFFVPPSDSIVPDMRYLVELSQYGRFSRGIATGANEFFILSKRDIARYSIPESDCLPCITKSMQIDKRVFCDVDFARLSESGAAVYLFSPGDMPSSASLRYVEYGERMKFDQRFITRHRTPWYKTEFREVSPLLINVFSRDGYKVVRNYSSALSLTNFHCFYPNGSYQGYVDWIFLYLLSSPGRKILSLSKRTYGNSLDKFEPNDLNSALVPSREFFDSIGRDTLMELMESVTNGDCPKARLDGVFSSLLLDEEKAGGQTERLFYPPRHRKTIQQLRLAI